MNTPSEPGAPVSEGTIPISVPHLGGNEAKYLAEAIAQNWVSSVGPHVAQFEKMIAERCGVRSAVATVNGTAAIHVALLAAGVEPDDEVLVSAMTFIASANAIRYANAWPVFIDAERDYWQIDPVAVRSFLENECEVAACGTLRNKGTGRRVRAIVPVHILGHPVDIEPIVALAREFRLALVEDAAEALGTLYKGRPAGSFGDAGCLSFNGNKLLTTGGGGAVLASDEALAKRVRYLTTQAKDDSTEFIHGEVGFNYRLTNIQAAVGVAQMEQLDHHIDRKRAIARTYIDAFASVPGLSPMREAPWAFSTHWMFTMLVEEGAFGMNRRALMARLKERNILTRPLWQPPPAGPAYAKLAGLQRRACPVADWLHENSISLPCSVGLTEDEQDRVIEAVKGCAKGAGR